ncbi:MAG TPA: dihydroorotate dehydrogenase (quinone), partial [Polyangiaceae bacterium]|nr:dihydroorotate dehydrogenase (quinone) [Polyangiaceae bacterium]
MPAETAHGVAFGALRVAHRLPGIAAALRASYGVSQPELSVSALGLHFQSPVLLAAGFDKHALGYNALGDLGFGGIEVGTITGEAQSGNPRPRLFRLARDR